MTRRLLESAKALIVHSEFMRCEMRKQGFPARSRASRTAPGFRRSTAWTIATGSDLDETHAADRHLWAPEALQAYCRIAARLSPAGAGRSRAPK